MAKYKKENVGKVTNTETDAYIYINNTFKNSWLDCKESIEKC
jgi:hypothetical protein